MTLVTGQPIVIADLVANPAPFFSIETGTGTTYSLTTVANQKVVVFVSGQVTGASTGITATLSLKYNGVTKHTTVAGVIASGDASPFALQYSEIPGAGTQNITVTTSAGTLSNVSIIVLKLLVG